MWSKAPTWCCKLLHKKSATCCVAHALRSADPLLILWRYTKLKPVSRMVEPSSHHVYYAKAQNSCPYAEYPVTIKSRFLPKQQVVLVVKIACSWNLDVLEVEKVVSIATLGSQTSDWLWYIIQVKLGRHQIRRTAYSRHWTLNCRTGIIMINN